MAGWEASLHGILLAGWKASIQAAFYVGWEACTYVQSITRSLGGINIGIITGRLGWVYKKNISWQVGGLKGKVKVKLPLCFK
jgi:hypothetical protein